MPEFDLSTSPKPPEPLASSAIKTPNVPPNTQGRYLGEPFDPASAMTALKDKHKQALPPDLKDISQLVTDNSTPAAIRSEAITIMYRAIIQAGISVDPKLDPEEIAFLFKQIVQKKTEDVQVKQELDPQGVSDEELKQAGLTRSQYHEIRRKAGLSFDTQYIEQDLRSGMLEDSIFIPGPEHFSPTEADRSLVSEVAGSIVTNGFMKSTFDKDHRTPFLLPKVVQRSKALGIFSKNTQITRDPRAKDLPFRPDYDLFGHHDKMRATGARFMHVSPYTQADLHYNSWEKSQNPQTLSEMEALVKQNPVLINYELLGEPGHWYSDADFNFVIPGQEAGQFLARIKQSPRIMELLIKQFYPDARFPPPDSNPPEIQPAANLILVDDFTKPINPNSWRYKTYQSTWGAGHMTLAQ